uniref:hypothetical protein n=1 Tax=Pseudomonas palleroniana TaxID=191390 RepID=UPI0018F86C19
MHRIHADLGQAWTSYPGLPSGGASTAANFIQRFVNDVTWAHLDISGPAHEVANPHAA